MFEPTRLSDEEIVSEQAVWLMALQVRVVCELMVDDLSLWHGGGAVVYDTLAESRWLEWIEEKKQRLAMPM